MSSSFTITGLVVGDGKYSFFFFYFFAIFFFEFPHEIDTMMH